MVCRREQKGRCVMRGTEIIKTLNDRRTMDHRFVKWWRKESDFLDYDLIDRFVANLSKDEEIGGIDFLTMDEMLREVKRVTGNRVNILHGQSGDSIEWVHLGKSGERTQVCTYSPESLITIFDVETHGNPVDS